jgi:hypothetical protein
MVLRAARDREFHHRRNEADQGGHRPHADLVERPEGCGLAKWDPAVMTGVRLVAFGATLLITGCLLVPAAQGAVAHRPTYSVPARRQPLTTNASSPVAHDTETVALVAHSGRLFAATDQWEYPGPSAFGQVLVKKSKTSPWTVFEQTQSLRVQALDSFPLPSDQGMGPGHSLLVTQAIVDGQSRILWLLDDANSFSLSNSYVLPSGADIRAFGAHESHGVWAVYAGVRPTGVLQGVWSPARRTLVFNPRPELTVAPPASPGAVTQKVTGFADCAGALYTTINTVLYRRNDGALLPGAPRWVPVYRAPPVGPHNSGLRGITCITHDNTPALLLSTEGNGNVYRFEHLPSGQLATSSTPRPGSVAAGLVKALEFQPIPAIRLMLAAQGTTIPVAGRGSIAYVIAAYNNGDFETITAGGARDQVFGFEWGYQGTCPAMQRCGPIASGIVHFNAAACFAVRSDQTQTPRYSLRCLDGPTLTPSSRVSKPIRSGQAFVSIRSILPSPFAAGTVYYGGYDCNFYPADGTAWVASSTLSSLRLPASTKGRHS